MLSGKQIAYPTTEKRESQIAELVLAFMNGPKNQTEAALRIIKTPAKAGANEESAAVFDFIVFRFRQGANASFIPFGEHLPCHGKNPYGALSSAILRSR